MAKKHHLSNPPEPNPKLRAGIGVTIQRSNGRTHAATIMQVNNKEQNCQVEWEEDKEIKAKQISLEQIYRLNQQLAPGFSDDSNENSAVPSPSSGVEESTKSSKKSSVPSTIKKTNIKISNGVKSSSGSKLENGDARAPENGKSVGPENGQLLESAAPVKSIPLKPWQRKKNMAGLSNQKKISRNDSENTDLDTSPTENQPISKRPNNLQGNKPKNNNLAPSTSKSKNEPTSRPVSRPTSRNNLRSQAKSPVRAKTPSFDQNRPNRALERNRPSSGHGIKNSKIPVSKNNPVVSESENSAKNIKNARQSLVVGNIAKIEEKRNKMRMEHAQQREQNKQRRQKYQHNNNWEYAEFVDEYRQSIQMNPLRKGDPPPPLDRRITVAVRKRPVNTKELDRGEVDCVSVTTKDIVMVHEPKQKVDLTKYLDNQEFRFDHIFDQNTDNELVYKYTAAPLVKSVSQGGMATCFAYGQTGTGKTHTMGGEFRGKQQNVDGGLYYFCARDLFLRLRRDVEAFNPTGNTETGQFYVACSFFEIYSGRVYDLMNDRERLRVMEDKKGNINVVGLRELKVQNVNEVLSILSEGSATRTSGKNAVNNTSSRSHAIFQLKIKTELNLQNKENPLFGQFSLVDLAGNERGSETANDRRVRAEGAEINKSLLALKECIRAMATNQKHLPFRGSQLTKVLRSSFLGKKSKTCMIAMVSPCADSCEQTLNTLRYADRVKELPVEGNSSTERMGVEDDSMGVIDVNELSLDGNLREENSKNNQEHISVESTLSGINLLGPSEEFKRLQQEEQDALKAADEVQMAEETWIQELEGLMNICEKLKLLQQQSGSADIDRDGMNNDARQITTEIQSQLNNFIEYNDLYREALQAEEQASQRLETARNALNKK